MPNPHKTKHFRLRASAIVLAILLLSTSSLLIEFMPSGSKRMFEFTYEVQHVLNHAISRKTKHEQVLANLLSECGLHCTEHLPSAIGKNSVRVFVSEARVFRYGLGLFESECILELYFDHDSQVLLCYKMQWVPVSP